MSLYALLTLVFFGTAFMLFFIFYMFLPKKVFLKERLESMTSYEEKPVFLEFTLNAWQKFLGRLGKNIPIRPQDQGKYQRMLVAAGIRKERVTVFTGSKILLTIILSVTYLIFYGIPIEKDFTIRVLLTVVFAIVGFLLPSLWLSNRVRKRKIEIFHDLPDLLDLMTVCVEAGLSMDASIIRVCEDEQFKKSTLASELRIAIQETLAGKPRIEALRDMGERAMVDDLRNFAAMLVQTERLGTSLALSLRIFSESMRTLRRQKAEEAAAKTGVKLLFPLVFLIFPALMLVILGPGIIRIMRLFASM